MAIIHELKTINPHFKQVWDGDKTFELRKNDRDFRVNDWLKLKEYDKEYDLYSGREVMCLVTHILENYTGIEKGYCILSIINEDYIQ